MLDVTFQTGRLPIPCDLAAVFCLPFKHFSGGSFQGEFSISTRRNNSQTIRLNNVVFKNVPLSPLVGPYTDFAVEGTIFDLRFSHATFGAEGTCAEGCLQVVDGAFEKTLFHHCVDRFQLTVVPETLLDSPMQMIPFTACVIHFRLQPKGIDFWADEEWTDSAFMYYQKGNLSPPVLTVYLPTQRRTVTYHELMSVFTTDGAPTVPLNQGLQSLVPYIPTR